MSITTIIGVLLFGVVTIFVVKFIKVIKMIATSIVTSKSNEVIGEFISNRKKLVHIMIKDENFLSENFNLDKEIFEHEKLDYVADIKLKTITISFEYNGDKYSKEFDSQDLIEYLKLKEIENA